MTGTELVVLDKLRRFKILWSTTEFSVGGSVLGVGDSKSQKKREEETQMDCKVVFEMVVCVIIGLVFCANRYCKCLEPEQFGNDAIKVHHRHSSNPDLVWRLCWSPVQFTVLLF